MRVKILKQYWCDGVRKGDICKVYTHYARHAVIKTKHNKVAFINIKDVLYLADSPQEQELLDTNYPLDQTGLWNETKKQLKNETNDTLRQRS